MSEQTNIHAVHHVDHWCFGYLQLFCCNLERPQEINQGLQEGFIQTQHGTPVAGLFSQTTICISSNN
eukprot:3491430-Ditylum_brightwellii.AAC.1